MKITLILGISIILFIVIRIPFVVIYWLSEKISKSSCKSEKLDLFLSIAFFFMYLEGFLGAAQEVANSCGLSNAEWYFVYTYIGVSAIIWCYFSWELKWKAKPQFAKQKPQMIVKKTIVFFCVMLFAFYNGYTQLSKNFGGGIDDETNLLVTLTNITIIPGVIAFDRVLNQISNYLNEKRKQ